MKSVTLSRLTNLAGYILFLTIVTLVGYVLFGPVFRFSTVECQYQSDPSSPCPETVVSALNPYLGKLTLFLPLDQIQANLISANPNLSQVILNVNLPQAISLTLTPAQSLVTLINPDYLLGFLVDDQLRVFQIIEVDPQTYNQAAIIIPGFNLSSGSYLAPDTYPHQAVQLFELLQSSSLKPSRIVVHSPDHLEVIIPQLPTVLFSLHQSLERQVTALQLVLPPATMQLSSSQIDVRLEKPVILIDGENKVQ